MQYNAREREKLLEELPRVDFEKRVLQNPTTQHLSKLINSIMLVSKDNKYVSIQ
jgi:hypothetical protein